MERVRAQKLFANPRDADVEILGTDSPRRNKAEWMCVRDFWMKYLTEAGARSCEYSVMRDAKAGLAQQNRRKAVERRRFCEPLLLPRGYVEARNTALGHRLRIVKHAARVSATSKKILKVWRLILGRWIC